MMKRSHGFTATCRSALCLLVPVFLFFALAALGAEEPKGDKATGKVEVRLSEHVIEMPNTLPAGPTTFLIHNEGKKIHSFKVEGPGVDALLSEPVPPRASGQLQVTLQPGEYKVYCPIGSHEAKGMTMKLTVTAKHPL
jgi:plastocyanin